MQKAKFLEPIFVDNVPAFEPSVAQKALIKASEGVNVVFVLWTRQVGKSNTLSDIFWHRLINESEKGQLYLTMSPTEGDIGDLMLGDILLEAFGGKDAIYDINAIYITPPKKWRKRVEIEFKADPTLYDYYIDNKWFLYHDDKEYVKLFIDDISNSGNGKKSQLHYTGKLFTGADIMCVAANHNLNKTVRGRKIKGVYGEEMGEYKNDPFGPILPAVLGQDGWMIYAGTPNETNPMNWVWEKYEEVVSSPYCEKKLAYGIVWYKSTVTNEIPLDFNDILNNESDSEMVITQTTLWSIGDLETIFPYVYKGNEKFARVQAQRKFPHKAIVKRDNFGKILYNDNKQPVFDIIVTQPNPTGLLTEEKYNREYRVRFDAGAYKAFPEFNKELNIIDGSKFNPEGYLCVAGYDHGVKDEKVTGTTASGKVSASCYVEIACIPVGITGEFQYVIYKAEYLPDPTNTEIASTWHKLLLAGMPIIAENVLWRNTLKGTPSDLAQIISADEHLRQDIRSRRGIFQCYKRTWQQKFADLNSWFTKNTFAPSKDSNPIKYFNPLNPLEQGKKLYITSDCLELIKYFDNQILVVDNKGQRSPKTMREDLYDAATYPLDMMEHKPEIVKAIREYWNLHQGWKRYDKEIEQPSLTYSQYQQIQINQQYGGRRNW